MAANLDLNLLPVARYAGREYPELLCLHVAQPPRRRARGRESDRLILYLAMMGNAPLPPGQQEEALANLAKLFYETPGSLTAALRRTAEELNKTLLDRNLHLGSSGRQGLGMLVQAALREGDRPSARGASGAPEQAAALTLALSGPAQVYRLSSEGVDHFYDVEMAERALGQSKATPITFFQANLQTSDTLLLAAQPAADWSVDALAGLHGQGPESLRRRLFGLPVTEVNAVLVQARPGKGVINLPKPGRPFTPPAPAIPVKPPVAAPAVVAPPAVEAAANVSPAAGTGAAVPQAAGGELPAPAIERPPGEEFESAAAPDTGEIFELEPPTSAAQIFTGPAADTVVPALEAIPAPEMAAGEAAAALAPTPVAQPEAEQARRQARPPAIGAALRAVLAALAAGLGAIGRAIRGLLTRILPEEALASIPSSVMAFTAVAIPVVIVAITTMVYGRLGTSAQYEAIMDRAREIGRRGIEQTDLSARQKDLAEALNLLDDAEVYGQTAEIESLRVEIQQALDEMDLALRIDFLPAIVGGLPEGVQIKRIAASEDELFILDGVSGNVLHARLSSQGYELDRTYICGLAAGTPGIGAALGIAAWSPGYQPEGNLLAMDEKGGVQVCKNGGAPQVDRLARPEATDNWGQVAAFTLDQGNAYVLDKLSKGVWIYPHAVPNDESTSVFGKEPAFFFNEEIPDVQNVVDLAANRDDLYMLHADGSLTLCFYSTFAGVPTRCSRPSYEDRRPGRENMPMIPPAPFTQIQNTQPPDPSLFMLEPQSQAIYHFSLRSLAFQRQYMPTQTLGSGPATAFFVDNLKRRMFLAAGGQVYYAVMP